MKLARASWFVVLVAIVLTLLVPALRQQLQFGLADLAPVAAGKAEADLAQDFGAVATRLLKPYQQRAVAFVNQRYASDPEMLMAAALLTEDTDLLKRAAEMGKNRVVWAAYVERLMQTAPGFKRIGSSGVDPADAEAVKEEDARIAESGKPAKLTPEQAEPVLSALRSWQEADPENALPVALEARYLYGLHRDKDALTVWAQAGRMPVVKSHAIERSRATQRLLVAMGMPKPEAMANADLSLVFPSYARLRDCARFAVYEGRLAAMNGDPVTAITWWQSTADFGRNTRDSADTLIGCLVGIAIQGIGAAPVWKWVPDHVSGVPDGPLMGGRYFRGDRHALYVEHMGEENDRELRDRLVLGKVRSEASREYTKDFGLYEGYLNATRYLGFAGLAFALIALPLIVYLALGTWSRLAADAATALHALWQLLLPVLMVAPLAAGAVVVLQTPLFDEYASATMVAALVSGLAGFVFLLVAIPPLAAIFTRAAGARFRTAWRGNLRRLLPVMIALCAIIFLGMSAYAARLRSQWAEKWSAPGVSEMSDMVRSLGDKWTHPAIPADAWRAEYSPEVTE
jgi:hypothetical protein